MRLRALALPLLLLAALPGAALAQDRAPAPAEIRINAASPGQDVFFFVHVDGGAGPAGGILQLTGPFMVGRQGEDVRVRTPATLRVVSEGPFRVTLASAPGEGWIQLVRPGGDREVTASGDVLTLAREEHGGPVKLVAAKEVHLRRPGVPASR